MACGVFFEYNQELFSGSLIEIAVLIFSRREKRVAQNTACPPPNPPLPRLVNADAVANRDRSASGSFPTLDWLSMTSRNDGPTVSAIVAGSAH